MGLLTRPARACLSLPRGALMVGVKEARAGMGGDSWRQMDVSDVLLLLGSSHNDDV